MSLHSLNMSNAIGSSRESNPSRRICHLRPVPLGHVAQIYNNSELKELAEGGALGLPFPDPLPIDFQDIPYFFLRAFVLRETLMKPYSQRGPTNEEKIFNSRLFCARRVVENAFGILANRFQILLTTMRHNPSTVKIIVKACIILHNLMKIRYPALQNQLLDYSESDNTDFVPGA